MFPQPHDADPQGRDGTHRKKANVPGSVGTTPMTDLQAKREQLLAAVERVGVALELSALVVRDDPIPFADAVQGEFKPFQVGDSWGPPGRAPGFPPGGSLPRAWSG